MQFRLYATRLLFQAIDSIRFPPGQSANILRGALGTILSRKSQAPDSDYARIFAPSAPDGSPGPSGLRNRPRPFVFRASHLDGLSVAPKCTFCFELNFFDVGHPEALWRLIEAFGQLVNTGIGPGRGRARLVGWERRHVTINLDPWPEPVHRVVVDFRTPTELKSGGAESDLPDFPILAARIRDRLSTLADLYGDGPLTIDFREFGRRAQGVAVVRQQLRFWRAERRSTRTGQTHSIGGFTGEVEYEGDLTEFVPYLHAASWTGVGRQTVWGKGEIAIRNLGG